MPQLEFGFVAETLAGWKRWAQKSRGYGLASVVVVAALLARLALDPFWGREAPFVTFFLAVLVVVRFTSLGPSVFAILLSLAFGVWFFLPPHHSFALEGIGSWLTAGIFLLFSFSLLIFWHRSRGAASREHRALAALERQRDELRANEEFNRRIIASSPDCILVLDLDGRLISMSQGGQLLLEIENLEPYVGRDWIDFWPEGYRDEVARALDKARAAEVGQFCAFCPSVKGTPRWSDVVVTPMCDSAGKPERLLAVSRDITDRRNAEQALRESQERLALAFTATDDAIWDFDLVQQSVIVNENYQRAFGRPPAGKSPWQWWSDRVHPDNRDRVVRSLREAIGGKARHWMAEYRFLHCDGTWADIFDRACIARDESGKAHRVVGAMMDLTALKRAEHRTELLAETAAALLKTDSPQRVVNTLCHKVMAFLRCEVFFNFLVNEEAGRLELNAFAGIPEEAARKVAILQFGEAVCGCAARDACRIVAEDIQGSADARASFVRSCGLRAYACHPLMIQDRILGTLSFGTSSRARFSEEELTVMKAVADLVAIAMDRQQNRAMLERVNAELEERVADRTRSLQETTDQLNAFCYSVAHDLRAPLRTQMGFARILLDDYGQQLDVTGRHYAKLVLQAAERQSNIITDLMAHVTVSRADLPLEAVPVASVIEQAEADLALDLEQKEAVINASGVESCRVHGNRSLLHLVVLNLLSNACKFTGPDHPPRVRLWTERCGNFVRLWVEDNGIGIDAKDLPRLFGMFQRLNRGDKYPGTGMGLAIVKRAAERMGGRVGVESTPGKGSRFWVELPTSGPAQGKLVRRRGAAEDRKARGQTAGLRLKPET
jgi:PAS domain S-box-containing protein